MESTFGIYYKDKATSFEFHQANGFITQHFEIHWRRPLRKLWGIILDIIIFVLDILYKITAPLATLVIVIPDLRPQVSWSALLSPLLNLFFRKHAFICWGA